ncbi:MAG: tetratricopeptide repeat protein [Gemmataceae bacterium]|nr:tetratricopeptide repeat protein [Gemmataceae bacterium]
MNYGDRSFRAGPALSGPAQPGLRHRRPPPYYGGWALLHARQPAEALTHFREALRLDPTNEWARDGLIEALKARYWVYR